MTIASADTTFRCGQIIDVPTPTAEMQAWLLPMADGSYRAEVVREEPEAAVVGAGERAVRPRARGRRV